MSSCRLPYIPESVLDAEFEILNSKSEMSDTEFDEQFAEPFDFTMFSTNRDHPLFKHFESLCEKFLPQSQVESSPKTVTQDTAEHFDTRITNGVKHEVTPRLDTHAFDCVCDPCLDIAVARFGKDCDDLFPMPDEFEMPETEFGHLICQKCLSASTFDQICDDCGFRNVNLFDKSKIDSQTLPDLSVSAVICLKCFAEKPISNKFCGNCGFCNENLDKPVQEIMSGELKRKNTDATSTFRKKSRVFPKRSILKKLLKTSRSLKKPRLAEELQDEELQDEELQDEELQDEEL
jgi:ribosomal protein L40E